MDLLEIKNREYVNISDIPNLTFAEFERNILSENKRVISFFVEENILYAVILDDENLKLYVYSTCVEKSYPSFTLKKPCMHMFEREIYENTGIEPIGHPFL